MISSFFSLLASLLLIPSMLGLMPIADAAATDDLSGFAWSSNVGWFSMNCTDASPSCSGTNYGVDVIGSGASKTLSGYAWSSNIGWITFNAAEMAITVAPESATCGTTGYPPCSPTATFNTTNGQVSGWARACSVFVSGCSGALKPDDERGGWDGWISLRDTNNYGVLANGPSWTGYAWGGGSVTGSVSPALGGNAVPGWISFRGYTNAATPVLYGVNATSNAVGPQVISCGVDRASANLSEVVTWSVVYDASIVSPTFKWISLSSEPFVAPVNGSTETMAYTAAGSKAAAVEVTVPSTGHVYVVDCNGNVVPGQTDPGFPSVDVATMNLTQDVVTTPVGAQQGVLISNLTGQFDYSGPAMSTPFSVRFEFDTNGDNTPEQFSNSITIPSLTLNQQNVVVNTGVWTPGTPSSSYRMRLCVDTGLVIPESNETDNCTSSWSPVFTVSAATPPISGAGAVCKPVPRVTQTNKNVTWQVTGVTGGSGTYTYDWVFTGGPSPVTNNPSPTVSYSAFGTKKATVTVHSAGVSDLVINCSVDLRVQTVEEI